MSEHCLGSYLKKHDCNGTTIYVGGTPAICKVKGVGIKIKVRCHSCQHCQLNNRSHYICTQNIMDNGHAMNIKDYRTTRCVAWRPKNAWIKAIKNINL